MAIFATQIIDKTENAKNNEIKILVFSPEFLKSHKIFSQTTTVINYCENQKPIKVFVIFNGAQMS